MIKHLLVTLGLLAGPSDPPIPYLSVQKLVLPDGICTAFSVNEEKGYWVTAAHCIDDIPSHGSINKYPVRVIWASGPLDLAVLAGPSAPGLIIAKEPPRPGTRLYKWGYGGGTARPWLSVGVSTDLILFNLYQFGHLVMLFDLEIEPGDSGCPIMTFDGKVISVAEVYWPKELRKGSGSPLEAFTDVAGGIDTPTLFEALKAYVPAVTH